jgi:hypothetical protein
MIHTFLRSGMSLGKGNRMRLRGIALALPICGTALLSTPVHAQMGYDPNTDPNLAFAQGLNAQTQGLNRALGDIDRCYQNNDQRACGRARTYDRQQKQQIGALEGLNAADGIRAGVARDQQRLMNDNMAHESKLNAQGYFGYADQARRAGNSEAAQSWQDKGNSALNWYYQYRR